MPFDGTLKGPGRPKGLKNKRTEIEAIISRKLADKCIKEDFDSGDRWVRQFVYEHIYKKPETTTKIKGDQEEPLTLIFNVPRPEKD
jgi:hypothetical protein